MQARFHPPAFLLVDHHVAEGVVHAATHINSERTMKKVKSRDYKVHVYIYIWIYTKKILNILYIPDTYMHSQHLCMKRYQVQYASTTGGL